MDSVRAGIADYIDQLSISSFDDRAVERAKAHLLDSFGCMLGGALSTPAKIALSTVDPCSDARGVTVCGMTDKASLGDATFANTVMLRYLDFNDMMVFSNGSHPSDTISGLLACAEYSGASGAEFLAAMIGAYEVLAAFGAGQEDGHQRGWDQVMIVAVGVAAAAAKLLGGNLGQIAHAVSITAVSNNGVRQTRVGTLSHWKGCSTAAAARNAVAVARLAVAGLTGPAEPFEGKSGICELVTGPMNFKIPIGEGPAILQSELKRYPCVYPGQAILLGALTLRAKVDPPEIERVEIETNAVGVKISAGDPSKWRPTSPETADHSLPFLVASALLDGTVLPESFREERLTEPRMIEMLDRVAVFENPKFTALYPGQVKSLVRFRLRSGEVLEYVTPEFDDETRFMKRDEVRGKFDALAISRIGAQRAEALAEAVNRIDQLDNVRPLAEPLAGPVQSNPMQSN